MKDCETCAWFAGYADNYTANCRTFESYKNFAVIERTYIRPISTQESACPYWKAKPENPEIEPYQKPVYDNALIFDKKQFKKRKAT